MTATDDPATDTTAEETPFEHGRIGYGTYARYTPFGLAAVLVVVLLAIGIAQRKPSDGNDQIGRLVGQPAPEMTLTLLDGSTLRLSDLRGSVVALNFWASWCAPCQSELPRFQAISANAAQTGDPIKIIGVGLKNDYDQNARDLVADLGLTFPIGRDTGGNDDRRGAIELAYGVSTYPATVFIRPDGTVDAVYLGEMSEDQLREYIDSTAT